MQHKLIELPCLVLEVLQLCLNPYFEQYLHRKDKSYLLIVLLNLVN
jgi:hypothetical protein